MYRLLRLFTQIYAHFSSASWWWAVSFVYSWFEYIFNNTNCLLLLLHLHHSVKLLIATIVRRCIWIYNTQNLHYQDGLFEYYQRSECEVSSAGGILKLLCIPKFSSLTGSRSYLIRTLVECIWYNLNTVNNVVTSMFNTGKISLFTIPYQTVTFK